MIRDYYETKAPEKNIKMSLIGFRNMYKVPAAASEVEVTADLVDGNEVPKRSAGGYKKLLRQLASIKE
mgnify:CR=1 FL=1